MKVLTIIGTLFAAVGLSSGNAAAQTQAASTTAPCPLAQVDKDFAQAASLSSSTEIDVSKLATSNSSDNDVKSFAHHTMLDHAKLTVQPKLALPPGVAVPKDNSDTAVLDSPKPLKGTNFDKAYITKVGLEGHQQAIVAFEKRLQMARMQIKERYRMAQQLASKKGLTQ